MGKKNSLCEFFRLQKQATVVSRATARNMAAASLHHRRERESTEEVKTSPAAESYFRLVQQVL